MPIITVLLAAASLLQAQDSWTLKAPMEPSVKLSWDVAVDASAEGQQRHATFQMGREIKPAKSADKPLIATFTWDKLTVDDQGGQDVPPMDQIIGSKGELLKSVDPSDDSYRQMLSPFVFIYPSKAVAVGDKWTEEIKPSGDGPKFTYEYTVKQTDTVHLAKATEKADDVSALVVSSKFSSSKDGVSGDGTWWISRAGRVLKFELKVKGWVVPMAGADSIDATIKAIARRD